MEKGTWRGGMMQQEEPVLAVLRCAVLCVLRCVALSFVSDPFLPFQSSRYVHDHTHTHTNTHMLQYKHTHKHFHTAGRETRKRLMA